MSNPIPTSSAHPDFRKLLVFGAGGSGRELAWLAEQLWGDALGVTFVVDHTKYLSPPINGVPVRLLNDIEPSHDARYVVGLGDPTQRERASNMLSRCGHAATTLVHPRAEVGPATRLGTGTVVCAGSILTCNVTVGEHVQVNLMCSVSHDVVLGDYTTLSPGVHVSGNVHIGRGVFVGTNACFINGATGNPLMIGDGAIIAAGACVTRDVPSGAMVAGVPAVRKR